MPFTQVAFYPFNQFVQIIPYYQFHISKELLNSIRVKAVINHLSKTGFRYITNHY
jgi:hypothetical protein